MNNSPLHRLVCFAAAFSVALLLLAGFDSTASALPPEQTETDSVDDALIELTLIDQHIRGDTRSWCQVRINVVGTAVAFAAGDEVFLWVYEDDIVGDEELWTTSFIVTAAEVSAQLVNRTLDCSSDFGSDASATLEIYAEARVEKSECGAFCVWDRPETAVLNVSENDDDSSEDDDIASTAVSLVAGVPASRMSVDTDVFEVTLIGSGVLDLSAFYRAASGRVDVELLDSSEALLVTATDDATGGRLMSAALAPGTYYVRVTPRAPPDYQFYDLLISVSSTSCAGGATEMRDCAMCGSELRRCEGSMWGAWGTCMMQGECAADAMETRACGGGGIETRVCSSACAWGAYGTCMGMATDDDAGVAVDAGVAIDAGGAVDAGFDAGPVFGDEAGTGGDGGGPRDAGTGSTDGGCSVSSAGAGGGPLAVFAALGGIAFWRRRRRANGR